MVYLDNAATTYPKPEPVYEKVKKAMLRYGGNPGRGGYRMSVETAEEVYRCREAAARLFGCLPENVTFQQNCTLAVNMALKGILRPGDHLLISDMEHNAVARPVWELCKRGGISCDVVPTSTCDDETAASFEKLIKPNTRMICCVHGSNVFGNLFPVGRIGRMARTRGIIMMVDAAQTAGVVPIHMEKDCIDILCAAGHKSLYGPPGTGLLMVTDGVRLVSLVQGGTGSNSLELEQPDFLPDQAESGTLNVWGISGLLSGIQFVAEKTPQALWEKELSLARRLWDGLSGMPGVIVCGERPEQGRRVPVVSFRIEGITGEETAQRLAQRGIALRGGYHCAPLAHRKMGTWDTGTARASIGAFNTQADIDILLEETAREAKKVYKPLLKS